MTDLELLNLALAVAEAWENARDTEGSDSEEWATEADDRLDRLRQALSAPLPPLEGEPGVMGGPYGFVLHKRDLPGANDLWRAMHLPVTEVPGVPHTKPCSECGGKRFVCELYGTGCSETEQGVRKAHHACPTCNGTGEVQR